MHVPQFPKQRGHENDITFVNKQEKALSTLKVKLMSIHYNYTL